ncbi:MAG: prephenate dehydrogenase/arogenate dehydrogenase family protein [Bacteroidales bacterium]|jgi:prephenate dehydrogenase|nr:prephenate dehydrogenase/arogenate dehydrogenase family protein [Bacteroidales bacterium]
MNILILGAGKMGSFFTDLLSFDYDVAVYEPDARKMRFVYNALRFSSLDEIKGFAPDMVINCVTLNATIGAFEGVLPYLGRNCILSDIASVKTGLRDFYKTAGMKFVSTHPMFGPTFANLGNLQSENAIIIKESDGLGKAFFKEIFGKLKLNVCEYTFDEHDEVVAYSLAIPFASTLVFGSVMKHMDAPGTTFKKHLAIARGLSSEDDFLLTEILFNPHTPEQLSRIIGSLEGLKDIIDKKDNVRMKEFLTMFRKNIE